jgi:hypothetical protein
MLKAGRISLALCASSLLLSLLVAVAQAGEPATVTVRVEGLNQTLLPATQVTTTAAPVIDDGNPAHACIGTSAMGALQLATNWSGPWYAGSSEYEIFSIAGETHMFEEGAPANYYWSFWLNETESSKGACGVEMHNGDRLLFFPACYGEACPHNPALPLGIEAPASANVAEPVAVTVDRYSESGTPSPVEGARVEGAQEAKITAAGGHATLSFATPGEYTLRVSAPETVRTETTICVHNGNDGNCGTSAPALSAKSTSSTGTVAAIPYKGPYALVADPTSPIDGRRYARGEAPRVLSGTVSAHSAVTSVSLELRREYRGRCFSYEGQRERFLATRCGQGGSFKVSSDGSFSYLLPSALAPGRYVLDIKASDAAGNLTALARGTSRIVFYVR